VQTVSETREICIARGKRRHSASMMVETRSGVSAMATANPSPVPPNAIPWGISLAAIAAFSFGGLGVVLYGADRDHAIPDDYARHEAGMHLDRVWAAKCEMLPVQPLPYPCHSCQRQLVNGRDVLQVQFVAGGDLLTVDTATGELVSSEKPKS
jgi:hypothetical protein